MFLVRKKALLINVIMILLLLSSTSFVVNNGLAFIVESVTFAVLLIVVFYYYIDLGTFYRKKYVTRWLISVFFLFSVGLMSHQLPIGKTIILLFTMYSILASAVMAENFMNSFEYIRLASYSLFIASFVAVFIALCGGEKLIVSNEGILGYVFAFTGGIVFKNYFGGNLLCVFIGLYIYRKFCRKIDIDKKVIKIVVITIFLSGSRGAILLLMVFIVLMKFDSLKYLKKSQRRALVYFIIVLFILVFLHLYREIALNSSTYMYRVRGVLNYFDCFGDEANILLTGNSELAYMGEDSYVLNIRKVTGYDGSMENAYLNIIVKNGLLGLIGYILIFVRYFFIFINASNRKYAIAGISILLTLLLSGLVESYLQSVHAVFGIYCYLTMAGISGMIHKEDLERFKIA